MSPETWSWVVAGASALGLWVSGQNPRSGWIYGIACQALWVSYGLAIDQPGIVALSFVFVFIYSRNLHRWRRTDFRLIRKVASASKSAPESLAS